VTRHLGVLGTGSGLAEAVYDNQKFVDLGLDTSDEWVKSRTGIATRHIASDTESTSTFATMAAKAAIKNAGLEAADIDLIVVATTTPDYPLFPSVACLVQRDLGISDIPAFDLSAACTGFVYALDVTVNLMKGAGYKNALVIGADTLSKNLDWDDRSTVVLFGDGAGAVVIGDVESGYGVLASKLGAMGEGFDKIIVPLGGSKTPLTKDNIDDSNRYLQMEGKSVFKFATRVIIKTIEEALEKNNLKKEDISFFIPHQANKRIIDYAAEKLGLSEGQVYVNIDRYGNTSSASIPIALNEVCEKKKLVKGDIIVTVGFGAGLTFGSNVIKWAG
jgi:3-oxoacyl-[acyl-carrier-protein] synthase III